MELSAGARLGPYEILSPLGEGGMGEVYRARDVKLQREVAIKILRRDLAGTDPVASPRLEREATALAALSHPNIGAIFGFEDSGQYAALVLELIEGPTLADQIAHGPIPIDEALAIAGQIAAALEAAHDQGIVHRDLKPSNIKIRSDGTVKVLDFGLARILEPASATASIDATKAPTVTGVGVVLGTPAYMAPEQANGQPADARSDIWAFGCVLFEMLTGRRPFEGASATETIAAILRGEPEWNALPANVPSAVRTLLKRCLVRDRARRLQHISTAEFVLDERALLESTDRSSAAASERRSGRVIALSVAAMLGVAVGMLATQLLRPRTQPQLTGVRRFELAASLIDPVGNFTGASVAIAPDGSAIAYTVERNGESAIVIRRLDQLEARPLAGSAGGQDPFFSPDGRQIGFSAAGELKRMPVDGGSTTTIWRGDPTFIGASWGADDTIVFGHDFSLYRMSAGGGQTEKIAAPDAGRDEAAYERPVLIPSSDVVLYTIRLRNAQTRVAARRLGGGDATVVIEDGFGAEYLPPGYLIYGQGDRLMGVRFDPSTLHVAGTPTVLEEGAFTKANVGVSNVAIARDGTVAYVSGRNADVFNRVVWLDRRGTRVATLVDEPLQDPRNIRLSPDASRVAITLGPAGQGQLWVYALGTPVPPVKLTFRDHNSFGIWSPDGRRLAFMSVAAPAFHVYSIAADGSAVQPETLIANEPPAVPLEWTPDGATLLVYRNLALWLSRPGDRRTTPWLQVPYAQYGARFSPDGRWLAYTAMQTGAAEVWVRPFPGPGAPVRVSASGGHGPVWARDGSELFFTNEAKMMAARTSVSAGEFRADAPRMLFEGGFVYDTQDLVIQLYDVAPDGRFLMIEPSATRRMSIVVAQHWDDELRRRLGTP